MRESRVVRAPYRSAVLLAAVLGACGTAPLAPVVGRSDGAPPSDAVTVERPRPGAREYRVKKGDTLYSIAFRNRLEYQELARWNRIAAPYRIYPGQRIRLSAAARAARAAAAPPAASTALSRPAIEVPTTPRAPPSARPAEAVVTDGTVHWQWPARGTPETGRQGVEIRGRSGQPVYAAAPGEVVYSGDGLVGYGKLIIVKHDDVYLSAYAHNRRILVTEGMRVGGGQQIAEMGSSGTKEVKLYFEIRRHGKPVPPLRYLPNRGI
ncbi:MAG: peptidoglycan DD-metalloendopeptidase family protein [Gammaproteobacteria bacterium]